MPLILSDTDHTVLSANNAISAFTRKHFPGGATTHIHIAYARFQLTTHLSSPRGRMAELAMLANIQGTVYPEEITCQLHVMAQARKSSSVIDGCSTHCATPPRAAVSMHGRSQVILSRLHCTMYTYNMAVATLVLSNGVIVTHL